MERFTHASQSQAGLQKLNFGNRGEQSNLNKVGSLKTIIWHFLHFSHFSINTYLHWELWSCILEALIQGIMSLTGLDNLYFLTSYNIYGIHERSKNRFILLNCRRGPLLGSRSSSKWYCTSDDSVKSVQYSEVCKALAYMLFYERISDEI